MFELITINECLSFYLLLWFLCWGLLVQYHCLAARYILVVDDKRYLYMEFNPTVLDGFTPPCFQGSKIVRSNNDLFDIKNIRICFVLIPHPPDEPKRMQLFLPCPILGICTLGKMCSKKCPRPPLSLRTVVSRHFTCVVGYFGPCRRFASVLSIP